MIVVLAAAAAPAGSSPTYVPGRGHRIETEDGRFALEIRSRLQLLQTVEVPDGGPATQGFTLRRARVDVGGHGFGPANRWRIQLGVSDYDLAGGGPLLDATWELAPPNSPVRLMVGQFKVPITRARIASTAVLTFVDRPVLDGEFSFDRDRGANVTVSGWDPDDAGDRLRGYLGVFQGNGRPTTLTQDLGVLVMARIEMLPLGAFPYHADGDLERSPSPRLGIGAAVARDWGAPAVKGSTGPAPVDGGSTDFTVWTMDVVLRWHGISLELTGDGRTGVRKPLDGVAPGDVEPPRNALGGTAQLSAMLPSVPVGLAARATAIDPIGASSMPRTREIGGAASWFMAGHPYDLCLDVHRVEEADNRSVRGRLQLEIAL